MDPEACLYRLALAIQSKDWSDAVAALNDYYQWRVKGGFEPKIVGTYGRDGDAEAAFQANRMADAIVGEMDSADAEPL